jgi:hypothetical protein
MNHDTTVRVGKAAACLALIYCLVLTMISAGQAAETVKSGEKIVLPHGWRGMVQLQDMELAKAWPRIKELPFNGLIIRTANFHEIMRPKELPWESWQQELDELTSVKFGHFTDNFLHLGFSHNSPGTTVDWFDDWTPVVKNLKNMTQVAKLAGMKGFVWDVEGYQATPLFCYPCPGGEEGQTDDAGRTEADYRARARGLGEEIMTEIREIYPDITIMTLFGYSASDHPGLNLLPEFLDGLLAASDPRFVLVDGMEGSYYDKDKADFARRYAQMRHPEEVTFRMCGEKERWAKQGQAGFALFVTEQRNGAWQSQQDLLDLNYFNPADFKRALRNAANQSDRYVWLYTEAAGWLAKESDWYPHNMAPVYLEIISEVTGVPYKPSRGALKALKKVQGTIVPKRLDIARLPAGVKPPAIDGELSDAAWSKAVHIPAFTRSRATAPLPETGRKTEAWVTCDSNNLYVAYRCHEPDMGSLITAGSVKRDSNVYGGDSVELWLTAGAGLRPFYQMIINPENFVFDRRDEKPEAYDGTWRSAVLKRDKDWQVELAFPWKDMGIKAPGADTTLRANLNRIRRGHPEELRRWHSMGYSSLSSEASSWSPYSRLFTEVTNLGYWTFK